MRTPCLAVLRAAALLVFSVSFARPQSNEKSWQPLPSGAGRLVLVGGGPVPRQARQRCLAGGGGRLLIVTAATKKPGQSERDWNEENNSSWEGWKLDVDSRFTQAGASSVDFLDESDPDKMLKQLANADAVWLSGGDQTRITSAYPAGSPVREALLARHRAGMSVCGTSAGAAALGDLMFTGPSVDGRPSVAAGMGFIPGVTFDTHFSQREERKDRLTAVVRGHPGRIGIGIDAESALEISGDQISILAGPVYFLRAAQDAADEPLAMADGGRFRLPAGEPVSQLAARSLLEKIQARLAPSLAEAQTRPD